MHRMFVGMKVEKFVGLVFVLLYVSGNYCSSCRFFRLRRNSMQ